MKLSLRALVKICFSVWVLSIIIFVILVVINNQNTVVYSPKMGHAVIVTILTGVFSFGLGFLFIILDYLLISHKKGQEKNIHHTSHETKTLQRSPTQSGLLFIIVILIVVVAYLLGSNNGFVLNTDKVSIPTIAPTLPTIAPTQIQVQQKQNYPSTNSNNDQAVHCNIHPNCGGGTTPLKKSECDNSICCQINGKWVFYKDKYQCGLDQGQNTNTNTNTTNSSTNRIPVFISYGGYTLNCPSQNIGAINSINSSMENKKSQWATTYNNCTQLHYDTNSCYVACKAGDINVYGECISTCPSAIDACKWVYIERDNLSKQILDLCK